MLSIYLSAVTSRFSLIDSGFLPCAWGFLVYFLFSDYLCLFIWWAAFWTWMKALCSHVTYSFFPIFKLSTQSLSLTGSPGCDKVSKRKLLKCLHLQKYDFLIVTYIQSVRKSWFKNVSSKLYRFKSGSTNEFGLFWDVSNNISSKLLYKWQFSNWILNKDYLTIRKILKSHVTVLEKKIHYKLHQIKAKFNFSDDKDKLVWYLL